MPNTRKQKTVVCDICGKSGARIRHLARTYGKGADLLVIEHIPAIACSHCGESYLTAETLHRIDRIKRQRQKLAKRRSVAVATFVE